MKWLAQAYTASKGQSKDSNPAEQGFLTQYNAESTVLYNFTIWMQWTNEHKIANSEI